LNFLEEQIPPKFSQFFGPKWQMWSMENSLLSLFVFLAHVKSCSAADLSWVYKLQQAQRLPRIGGPGLNVTRMRVIHKLWRNQLDTWPYREQGSLSMRPSWSDILPQKQLSITFVSPSCFHNFPLHLFHLALVKVISQFCKSSVDEMQSCVGWKSICESLRKWHLSFSSWEHLLFKSSLESTLHMKCY